MISRLDTVQGSETAVLCREQAQMHLYSVLTCSKNTLFHANTTQPIVEQSVLLLDSVSL